MELPTKRTAIGVTKWEPSLSTGYERFVFYFLRHVVNQRLLYGVETTL